MIIEKLKEGAVVPKKGTINSAGWDLTAIDYEIKKNGIVMFDTGWKVAIATHCFGAIYIRSGIASKGVWALANGVGVIDSDYRGPIKVLFRYLDFHRAVHWRQLGTDPRSIAYDVSAEPSELDIKFAADDLIGQRIAQLIIQPYKTNGLEVGSVNDTSRGEGGFGSTGK